MTASERARPTRIVRIITRLNVGGPAKHVVWLSEALSDDAFETRLVTGRVPAGEADMSAFAAERGVSPIVFDEMSRELSPRDLLTIWKMYRLFRRERPDIVHTHTAKAGAVGRAAGFLYKWLTPGTLIGRPRRCRFVHTFHGHVFHGYYSRLKSGIFINIERLLARVNTERIIVLTPQQLEEIRDRFHVGRPAQFRIVNLGIDFADLLDAKESGRELRRELGLDAAHFVISIIGRLTAIKDHVTFLRAAAKARGDLGASVRFVIFGEGTERSALEKEIARLGIGDIVIFAGTRSASAIYAASDMVALTSRNEGTPLTLIEAMAAGVPVVSTIVGGVVDLLGPVVERHGNFIVCERGVGAPAADPEAFAAAMVHLAKDAALRQRVIENARAYALKTFSKERLVADIIRLYREFDGTSPSAQSQT